VIKVSELVKVFNIIMIDNTSSATIIDDVDGVCDNISKLYESGILNIDNFLVIDDMDVNNIVYRRLNVQLPMLNVAMDSTSRNGECLYYYYIE